MYQFTEDCLTGIEQIDKEHEKLFGLINQTVKLLNNELLDDKYHQVSGVLEELRNYTDTHFANEEAYMAAINDPELERQKKQHMAFREKINMLGFANIDELKGQQQALDDLLKSGAVAVPAYFKQRHPDWENACGRGMEEAGEPLHIFRKIYDRNPAD